MEIGEAGIVMGETGHLQVAWKVTVRWLRRSCLGYSSLKRSSNRNEQIITEWE